MTNMTVGDILLIIIAASMTIAVLLIIIGTPLAKKRREKKRDEKLRYLEARRLARDFINAQLDYTRSVHAIDDATIAAFETIIATIAKHRENFSEDE